MNPRSRRARVRALAKLNLSLKILHKRPDGYHELRTIYQTISLADLIDLEFTRSRRTDIDLKSNVDIADNLVVRAARLAMDAMRITGRVSFRLTKRIPTGAGLGGGSSDAAAVLIALPVLAGRRIPPEKLLELAGELGSDVPFFLVGGTAVGLGRGTEVYPLPDLPPARGLVIAPGLHVSTAEAYRALGRELTLKQPANIINSFQSSILCRRLDALAEGWPAAVENDFEEAVFRQYPQLKSLKRKLLRLGADPVMMTGSGSAVFGLFRAPGALEQALSRFREEKIFPITLVSRARFRSMWRRSLAAHIDENLWPL
jgi:4-diphosphocytidyl-2-C-methyl-D-erythritol kinase